MNEHDENPATSNVTVVVGTVHSEPLERALPGGGMVVQFDITTRIHTDGRQLKVSVPVAWNDPTPAQLGVVAPGEVVVVVGTVRRRFFRVGGVTQSRTEVVAEAVIPPRRRKQLEAALRAAADRVLAVAA